MSDTQKEQVFEQIEKIVPLQASVSVLLPAFLAINGNVEPAKRVKIMLYMFSDQLEHMKRGEVILRMNDLEKLKTQMTRCIGFVRLSNDQLAQKLISKESAYIASQVQLYAGKRAKKDDKRARAPADDKEMHGKPLKRVKSSTDTPPATPPKTATPNAQRESINDALRNVQDAAEQRHSRHAELAHADPVAFVQLAWNELATAQSQKPQLQQSSALRGIDDPVRGDESLFSAFASDIDTPGNGSTASPPTPDALHDVLGMAAQPPEKAAAETEITDWWEQHYSMRM